MSDPRDFLIDNLPGDFHSLKISWSSDRSCIYFHSNGGTKTLDENMAEQILRGLMAILRGGFTRAISETALRLELEEKSHHSRNVALATVRQTPPSAPPIKPELDML